jgi:hypothetical protein
MSDSLIIEQSRELYQTLRDDCRSIFLPPVWEEAPPGKQEAMGTRRLVEEVLEEHGDEDTPIVRAFEEAMRRDA